MAKPKWGWYQERFRVLPFRIAVEKGVGFCLFAFVSTILGGMFLKLKSPARRARNAMNVFFVVIIMIFVAIAIFSLIS